jgi:hypothetical protein
VAAAAAAREVFDVSGAGDTVVAAFALATAAGASASESATFANRAAAVVVGKHGTSTVSPEEMLTSGQAEPQVVRREDLRRLAETLRGLGKRIVKYDNAVDLQAKQRNNSATQKQSETIFCVQGDHNSANDDHHKKKDDEQTDAQTELFADHRKNKVGVRIRQIIHFLPAVAESMEHSSSRLVTINVRSAIIWFVFLASH